PGHAGRTEAARHHMTQALDRHARYILDHGEDMPEVTEWRWCP
ncbi:hypothetical protein ACCS63_36975, partial [Rhizobium brockwellii]